MDGKPAALWRANYAFQAVEVPSGRHEVRLVYADRAFWFGTAISLVELGVLRRRIVEEKDQGSRMKSGKLPLAATEHKERKNPPGQPPSPTFEWRKSGRRLPLHKSIVNNLRIVRSATFNNPMLTLQPQRSLLVAMIDSVHPETGTASADLKKSRRKTSATAGTPKIDRLPPAFHRGRAGGAGVRPALAQRLHGRVHRKAQAGPPGLLRSAPPNPFPDADGDVRPEAGH